MKIVHKYTSNRPNYDHIHDGSMIYLQNYVV